MLPVATICLAILPDSVKSPSGLTETVVRFEVKRPSGLSGIRTKSIKNQYFRVFLTEILHSDLSDAAKCVYRYFYRFSDSTAVHRDYWQLMGAFAWASNKTRFVIWLKNQLTELKAYGVVEDFAFAPGSVSVKCAPISAIKTAKKVSTKTITVKEDDHASMHVH